MAISLITVGLNYVIATDGEYTGGPGVAAPIGSLGLTVGGQGRMYRKFGNGNNDWYSLIDERDFGNPIGIIGEPWEYDVTATPGDFEYYTVGVGQQALITQFLIVCFAELTGTVEALNMKIGTVGNSFNDGMGSGGYTFNAAVPTTLITETGSMSNRELLALTLGAPMQPSQAPRMAFGAGEILGIQTSGTALSSGSLVILPLGIALNE